MVGGSRRLGARVKAAQKKRRTGSAATFSPFSAQDTKERLQDVIFPRQARGSSYSHSRAHESSRARQLGGTDDETPPRLMRSSMPIQHPFSPRTRRLSQQKKKENQDSSRDPSTSYHEFKSRCETMGGRSATCRVEFEAWGLQRPNVQSQPTSASCYQSPSSAISLTCTLQPFSNRQPCLL